MQNSGLGNIVNPLTSLIDPEVYSIPMLLLIGFRGSPGLEDEPQHKKMGRISLSLLECFEIPYKILSPDQKSLSVLDEAFQTIDRIKSPFALLVEPQTFSPFKVPVTKKEKALELSRQEALEFCVKGIEEQALIISTTGHLSRELYKYRFKEHKKGINSKKDFKVIGAMGHALSLIHI